MLGDGKNPSSVQLHATSCLFDLARTPNGKSSIAKAHGVAPLVQLLSCGHLETQQAAAGTLWLLSTSTSVQPVVTAGGGIEPSVALLSSESLVAATHAANTLRELSASADNKGAIVRAGGIVPLVAMLQGSTARAELAGEPVQVGEDAVEAAVGVLAELATAKKEDARSGIARAGAIPTLISLLSGGSPIDRMSVRRHAACALWGLSQEPAYALEITQAGAVAVLIEAMKVPSDAQGHAVATMSNIVKELPCVKLLTLPQHSSVNRVAHDLVRDDAQLLSQWLKSQAASIISSLNPKRTAVKSAGRPAAAVASGPPTSNPSAAKVASKLHAAAPKMVAVAKAAGGGAARAESNRLDGRSTTVVGKPVVLRTDALSAAGVVGSVAPVATGGGGDRDAEGLRIEESVALAPSAAVPLSVRNSGGAASRAAALAPSAAAPPSVTPSVRSGELGRVVTSQAVGPGAAGRGRGAGRRTGGALIASAPTAAPVTGKPARPSKPAAFLRIEQVDNSSLRERDPGKAEGLASHRSAGGLASQRATSQASQRGAVARPARPELATIPDADGDAGQGDRGGKGGAPSGTSARVGAGSVSGSVHPEVAGPPGRSSRQVARSTRR